MHHTTGKYQLVGIFKKSYKQKRLPVIQEPCSISLYLVSDCGARLRREHGHVIILLVLPGGR